MTVPLDCASCEASYVTSSPRPSARPVDISATGYAVAQKVYESEGSLSGELGLVFGHRFRITGGLSHYMEEATGMTVGSLTAGVHVGELGGAPAWLEAGVTHLATQLDGTEIDAVTGAHLGVRFEQPIRGGVAFTGTAGALLFDDFYGLTARAAVRVAHVELGLRVLDFDVAPALFGPEIGFGF